MADLPPFGIPGTNALSTAYPMTNFVAAKNALNMTPQEQALYLRHLANLYGSGGVDNPDGSRSTIYSIGNTGDDGRYYIMPSVYDGKILSPDNAIAQAMAAGLSSFPSYQSEFQGENRYQRMHNYMERDTDSYLRGR